MRRTTVVVVTLVCLIILLAIGVMAGRVGGIAIRRQGDSLTPLTLTVSEPLVRGVPTTIHWEQSEGLAAQVVSIAYRDSTQEHEQGQVQIHEGRVTLVVPCDSAGDRGSIVLRQASNKQVVAWREVAVAPAGPECVR